MTLVNSTQRARFQISRQVFIWTCGKRGPVSAAYHAIMRPLRRQSWMR